jgi:hypothetical protein
MLNFEVVKTRQRNTVVEKYDFPVLVINPRTDIIGGVQKFELNKAAVKEFAFNEELENFVGLAFNVDNDLVLVNLNGNQVKISAKVNKDYSFNSRKIYDLLAKKHNLFPTDTYEFRLVITTDEESGLKFGGLAPILNENLELCPSYEDDIKEEMYYGKFPVDTFNEI